MEELSCFHSPSYLDFLQNIKTSSNAKIQDGIFQCKIKKTSLQNKIFQTRINNIEMIKKYLFKFFKILNSFKLLDQLNARCPIQDGLWDYCLAYATGSLYGAKLLNEKVVDVMINWSGGMHHARKDRCIGAAPINDIVLAILSLQKTYKRVLYVDLDAEHGSGVEEAFYASKSVLTCSFHTSLGFPGSGTIDDVGMHDAVGYAVNVPFTRSISDMDFEYLYQKLLFNIYASFQPTAIVVQMGGNSLSGDRSNLLNYSMITHGSCLTLLNDFNLPMLVLGGSGNTLRNTARTWAYETALLVGATIPSQVPASDKYYEHYGPDYDSIYGKRSYDEDTMSREQVETLLEQSLYTLSLMKK